MTLDRYLIMTRLIGSCITYNLNSPQEVGTCTTLESVEIHIYINTKKTRFMAIRYYYYQ